MTESDTYLPVGDCTTMQLYFPDTNVLVSRFLSPGMAETRRMLTIAFREPPRRMFAAAHPLARNELAFDLGDRGGITARFNAKVPGPDVRLGEARFRFDYDDSFGAAHDERLTHDALVGDATLFTRADGIECLWGRSATLLGAPRPVRVYQPGSWGPPGTDELIAPARWQLPAPITPGGR